jgi:small subunit ribosomal protein S16
LSVKIRLKKMGSKKRPFYRIVAADSRSPRDGRFIEMLGYYNPVTDPPEIVIDDDKVYKWLDQGAKPTVNAANVLREKGLLERWRLLKEGVSIAELDAKIEERRAKQPKPVAKKQTKLSKKAAERAKQKAEEETTAAGEEETVTEQKAEESEEPAAGEESKETGGEKAE